jgi:hypothetical protein
MIFEKWVEEAFRSIDDVKAVKRTDVSEKPHKHEDIKDIPADPDMNIFFEDNSISVWITHKEQPPKRWSENRAAWIRAMFWRFKTYKYMKKGQYLLYGVLHEGIPYEVIWEKFDDMVYVGLWNDEGNPDQDDWRAKLDMSKSLTIFTEKGPTFKSIKEIL